MNKKFSLFSVLAGFFLLFSFVSCSEILGGNNGTGSVSFTFDQDFAQKITAEARSAETEDSNLPASESDNSRKEIVELTVALSGDYSDRQTISFNRNDLGDSKRSLKFDGISVGSSVRAVCLIELVTEETYDGQTHIHRHLQGIGVSPESVSIKSGDNFLQLPVKTAVFGYNEGFFGTAQDWEGQFCFALLPDSGSNKMEGYYGIINYSYGGFVSGGRYKILAWNEKGSREVEITEYAYLAQDNLKEIYAASGDSSPKYQFVTNPETVKLVSDENSHFKVNLANGITVNFGMLSAYTLTVSKDGDILYEDSDIWYRDDSLPDIYAFNSNVQKAFEYHGLSVYSSETPDKRAGEIKGLAFEISGTVKTYEDEAFFPTGYDSSKVKAWFFNHTENEKANSSQEKLLAIYLMDDGKLLATKIKHELSDNGKTDEKEIDREGTYTLSEADNYEKNKGTATFTIDGKSETYKFGLFNDLFFAYSVEQPSGEDKGILVYAKRSDAVPAASEATKVETPASGGQVSATVKKAKIVLDSSTPADLYLNNYLKFNLLDAESGEKIDFNIKNISLFYAGNELDPSYYICTLDTGKFQLNTKNPLLTDGTYQIYIEMLAMGTDQVYEKTNATFDVEIHTGYGDFESLTALYDSAGNFALVSDADIASTNVSEKKIFTASASDNVEFDPFGNVYLFDESESKVYSNSNASDLFKDGVSLTELSAAIYKGLAIDVKENKAYGWYTNDQTFNLIYYPKFLVSGSIYGSIPTSVSTSGFYASNASINNNMLYLYGSTSGTDSSKQVWAYDISNGLSSNSAPKYKCNLDENLPDGLAFAKASESSNDFYNDMYAVDGAVYLLVRQNIIEEVGLWNTNIPDVNCRGAIVKVTWQSSGSPVVEVLGLTNNSITQDSIKQMYLFAGTSALFDVTTGKPKTMLGDSTTVERRDSNGALENYGKADGYKFFPNVNAISDVSDSAAFAAPSKVIGIKPRKLVIADDGYAFYTDSDGALCFKNANRVVTIDLEKFVIESESVQTTKASFDKDITSYLRSSITIDNVRSGGTYYDYNASVYYYDASNNKLQSTLREVNENIYLAVKNVASE